jgi:hypothetical protein
MKFKYNVGDWVIAKQFGWKVRCIIRRQITSRSTPFYMVDDCIFPAEIHNNPQYIKQRENARTYDLPEESIISLDKNRRTDVDAYGKSIIEVALRNEIRSILFEESSFKKHEAEIKKLVDGMFSDLDDRDKRYMMLLAMQIYQIGWNEGYNTK